MLTVMAGVAWCAARVAFIAGPTTTLQFLSLAAFTAFVVGVCIAFVRAFAGWRERRWLAVLPLATVLAAHCVSGPMGATIRDVLFRQSLPGYEAVIHRMESGAIEVPRGFTNRPEAESALHSEQRVFAERTADGALLVEFNIGSGFPVKHTAYLYTSSGVIPPGSRVDKRWPFRDRVRDKWFHVEN